VLRSGNSPTASTVESATVGLNKFFSPQIEKLDPTVDGWDTEKFGDRAKKALQEFGKILEHPGDLRSQAFSALIAPDFGSDELRPRNLREVFGDGSFRVFRGEALEQSKSKSFDAARIVEAFDELLKPYKKSSDLRVHFKVYKIEKEATEQASSFWTRSFFESSATTANGSAQQSADWRCLWRQDAKDSNRVQLVRIEVKDYEEVILELGSHRLFRDCTEAVLSHAPCYAQQLVYSQTHWTRRLPARLGVGLAAHHGLAIGDANGDGLDDIYACRPGGLPNLLLIHQKDGTVVNEAEKAGVDWLDSTASALFVDLDNDADQDLVVGFGSALGVFRNDGELRFHPWSTLRPANNLTSLTAADFDSDGLIDLFACFTSGGVPYPYEDAANGEPNRLYRNVGDGQFRDVSAAHGIDPNRKQFSFAAAWEDYDNDGDLDIYVANDFGRNNLYLNAGKGKFRDAAAESGVEDIAAGMSVSWGDYDQDGWMDLYVSNMFSAAGNRVAYQRNFRPQATDQNANFQRHARGNSLFLNNSDRSFSDASVSAAVTMGRWSWGSRFADINNDGLEDLLVSNGNMTSETTADL
jgi:hypothetical protein